MKARATIHRRIREGRNSGFGMPEIIEITWRKETHAVCKLGMLWGAHLVVRPLQDGIDLDMNVGARSTGVAAV